MGVEARDFAAFDSQLSIHFRSIGRLLPLDMLFSSLVLSGQRSLNSRLTTTTATTFGMVFFDESVSASNLPCRRSLICHLDYSDFVKPIAMCRQCHSLLDYATPRPLPESTESGETR